LNDKVIVTNRSALVKKYDSNGIAAIGQALKDLVDSDKQRGIETKIVHIDSEEDMRGAGNIKVINALDARQNKEAIDAIYNSLNPDYLVILGAPDVIPHQDLKNPVFAQNGGDGDDDAYAWSDLPYACNTPYSQDTSSFIGPTRVVGRIPDLFGASEPSYLISLLRTASQYKSRPIQDYGKYLGLTAEVWKGSSSISIRNIFGNDQDLLLAPPSGPEYPNGQLNCLIHFINCHGATAAPEFYGQTGNSYPISLTTQKTSGQIREGTIAAVECCYGAELYDSATLSADKPICQSYLEQGTYGYFGSTTIAYGPADTNGSADLICQYFLIQILNGASIGRAALMARQQYVGNVSQMDAVDLKTLAQFYLLGDPSIQPIVKSHPTDIPPEVDTSEAERFTRAERREKMKQMGEFLSKTKPTASKQVPAGDLSSTARDALSNIVKKAGLPSDVKITAFGVETPPGVEGIDAKATVVPSRYLIAIGIPHGTHKENIKRGVAVVAKELNGRIINYRIYHQR
jgi:hypothetical protein